MRDGPEPAAHHARDLRARHDRHVSCIADRAQPERGRTADGEFELVGVGVLRLGDAEDDGHARAPGLLVLTHHEAPGLRGGLPVDVPARVAGRVFADGVERHVRVDEAPRRAALEVADQSGAGGRQGRRPRVDVEFVDVLERVLAAEHPDGVAADGGGRTDLHDPAPEGGDLERLGDGVVGAQQRNAELDEALADGDVDATGERDTPAVIAHQDLAGHAFAGDESLVREREVHVVRARPEQERDARDQQEQRGRAGDHPLDPAEHDPESEPHRRGERDEGARGTHRPRAPLRCGGESGAHRAPRCRPTTRRRAPGCGRGRPSSPTWR